MPRGLHDEYRARGAEDARGAIEAGDPQIVRLQFDYCNDATGGWVQRGTGLPILSFGCDDGPERRAYRDGYNRVIRETLRTGALDRFRMAHLFTTDARVAEAFQSVGSFLLGPSHPTVDSPRGRFRLEAIARRDDLGEGRGTWEGVDLRVTDRSSGVVHLAQYWRGSIAPVRVRFVADDTVAWIETEREWMVQYLPRWHLIQTFERTPTRA